MYTHYEGQLVRLRPFRDQDEYKAMALEQGIEMNAHWGCWYHPGASAAEDFKECGALGTGGYNGFIVERIDTGEVIGMEEYGMEGVHIPQAWVGTYILPTQRGRRFGVEAKQLAYCYLFENFPLERVYSDTVETHVGAAKGLMLSGMRYCGRLQRSVTRDGRCYDRVLYELFREEWEGMGYRHAVRRGADLLSDQAAVPAV